MFRKHTQFFSSFARHTIDLDPQLVLSPGVAKAMELPGDVIRLAIVSETTSTRDQLWSQFHLGVIEAVIVTSALRRAARIESVLSFVAHGGLSNTAQIDIEFFRKGEMDSHFVLSFNVDLESAEIRHVAYRTQDGPGTMVYAS